MIMISYKKACPRTEGGGYNHKRIRKVFKDDDVDGVNDYLEKLEDRSVNIVNVTEESVFDQL